MSAGPTQPETLQTCSLLSSLHRIRASISSINKLRIPQLPSFQREFVKIDQLMFEEYFQDEQLYKSPVYEADPQLEHATLAARTYMKS